MNTTRIVPAEQTPPAAGPHHVEFHVGTVLWDRYEILAVLGSSELGELWRCHDREENKEVSLRWLPADLRRSKQVLAIIHASIRRIANQTHPHLAAIRQLVYVGDQIYVVGDFAPGIDLLSWLRGAPEGRRSLPEVVEVLRQAAEALDFAHERKIIHRNLKPSNVFIDEVGAVRVTDFGLAPHHHLTIVHGEAKRTGVTGPYLAPELRDGGVPDAASDQYALGALAWKLLAGRPPAEDGGGELPDGLPASARTALRRAMSPQPRNRYVNCADFVRALNGERVSGRRGRSAAEWRRIVRRAGGAAAVLLAGLGLVFGGRTLADWLDQPRTPPPRSPAPQKPAPEVKVVEPVFVPPEPLTADTPLPESGHPWVAATVPMEFVWVGALNLWVGRYEVVNAEYRAKEPDHDSGEYNGICLKGSRQPVVRVNFDDCAAYAAWLTEREREAGKLPPDLRYRLPSLREAVAYTRAGLIHAYPWGPAWPPVKGNYADKALAAAIPGKKIISGYQDGFALTAPVERSGENAWGLFGAGGNVWETTSRRAGWDEFGGWQGGGWEDYQPVRLQCDAHYGFIGNARGAVNGFRLVLGRIADETPLPEPEPPAAPAP